MKFLGHLSIFTLACMFALGFVLLSDTASAQRQNSNAETAEADPEAEAQASGEEGDDPEAQQQRRRRGPNKATIEFNGETVAVQYGEWAVDGVDYENIDGTAVGTPIVATLNAALKLITDWDLKFGEDTVIKKENVAKDYPGVYSIWLKKTANGWSMAFNEKADVWGTMYDPQADVAEIPVEYSDTEEPNEKMEITLEESDGGAIMTIAWGKHQWTTSFDPVPES